MTSNRGFTLIELLVVIAIIGVLSSVVLASLNSARMKSRDAQRLSSLRQVRNALEIYYASTNQYPGTTNVSYDFDCGTVQSGNTFTDLSTILPSEYIPKMSATLGDRCLFYTKYSDTVYFLRFQPEQQQLTNNDHDCWTRAASDPPGEWYCIRN